MSQECRNDCVEDLLFPKEIKNRPGLSGIDYRIGVYNDILEAMLRQLNTDPLLSAWTHREPDDPGIALLEGAAVVGDILTFYQQHYANEAYLRTAKWRETIAHLVRLTGYLLSPGVGGKATFALEVKDEKDKNKVVTIPKGMPIKAQVESDDKAVEFETLKETTAYPSLNKFNLYRPLEDTDIEDSTTEFYIFSPGPTEPAVQLEEGDRLLIGRPAGGLPAVLTRPEIVVVEETRQLHSFQLVKIKGLLKYDREVLSVSAYKLGRSFRHFGHNTPLTFQHTVNNTVKMENQLFSRPLDNAVQSVTVPETDVMGVTGVRIVDPELAALDFPLDSEVDDLAVGRPVIIRGLFYRTGPVSKEFTLVGSIHDITSATMTWGAVSGAASLVTLDYFMSVTDSSGTYNTADIRFLQLHEVIGPVMQLHAKKEETSLLSGKDLYFFGTEAEVRPLEKRRLMFDKSGAEPFTATAAAVETLAPSLDLYKQLRKVTLDREVTYGDFPNENPLVDVYGNLVDADQGKTEKEAVLGSGDNRQNFQSFKLPKAPLTYHNQAGETPPEVPELEIYVEDRLWTRVPVFFGRGPKEEIYIVREDADNNSWVQFGDGKTGARLPSGLRNVKALYRTGTGAYGALKEGTNPRAGGKVDRMDKVYMPQSSSGGDQPETGDNAREAAPGKTQGLGRLVSLRDFESEALAVPGVSKTFAAWEVSNKQSAVLLTLLMETGRSDEFGSVRDILNKYNICRGPQRFPITVIQGKRSYIYIHAEFALAPSFREDTVKDAVKTALGICGEEGDDIDGSSGLFGSRVRRFAQDAYVTRIEAVIKNVEGVVWAKVKALESLGEADDPVDLTIPTAPGFNAALSCDDTHILCLYKTHLQLSIAKEETAGRC